MQHRSARRARAVAAIGAMAVVGGLLVPSPVHAATSDEARLLTLTNSVRASVGAAPLALDGPLSAVARAWAAAMAAAGTISHNGALPTQVTGWSALAENVGMGSSVDVVHQALVASRTHYLNLTDTEVQVVGIAVVSSGGNVFVVEDFLGRSGAAAAQPAPPAPPPAPVPTTPPPTTARSAIVAPAARPAPAPAPEVAPEPSTWMALALELTRSWERTQK